MDEGHRDDLSHRVKAGIALTAVLVIGGLLIFFALLTATHKCGDVGCGTSSFTAAWLIAAFGLAAGVFAVVHARRRAVETPPRRERDDAVKAGTLICVLAYIVSLGLTVVNG